MECIKKPGGGHFVEPRNTRGDGSDGVDNAAFTSENGENRAVDVSMNLFNFLSSIHVT